MYKGTCAFLKFLILPKNKVKKLWYKYLVLCPNHKKPTPLCIIEMMIFTIQILSCLFGGGCNHNNVMGPSMVKEVYPVC